RIGARLVRTLPGRPRREPRAPPSSEHRALRAADAGTEGWAQLGPAGPQRAACGLDPQGPELRPRWVHGGAGFWAALSRARTAESPPSSRSKRARHFLVARHWEDDTYFSGRDAKIKTVSTVPGVVSGSIIKGGLEALALSPPFL
ncbi:unnamed protein product, partial [Gulo gulo]